MRCTGKEAIKGVQEILKDATPFKMAATIIFIYYLLYFVILADEHVLCLYGEVQRHRTTPAKLPISSTVGSLRAVQ